MDQIKKRLEIIKIAIFMSDDETIRLQLLKLEYFGENEQLDKIINLLKRKNYGQAQVLISEYLDNPKNTNKQTVENDEKEYEDASLNYVGNKQSIVDEFELLKSNNTNTKYRSQTNNQNTKQNKTKNSITSYVTNNKNFELSSDEIEKIPSKKQIQKELPAEEKVDFSDIFIPSKEYKNTDNIEEKEKEINDEVIEDNEPNEYSEKKEDTSTIEPTDNKDNELGNENLEGDLDMLIDVDIETIIANSNSPYEQDTQNKEISNQYDKKYPPISDIFHRFQNIALFHIEDKNYTLHKSAANWMYRISNVGYKEIEILKISKYIHNLKESKQHDEAIQLTLICCATESNLGKLIFARELYKGDMLEKDYLKACEMTKELALLDYSEALCDLGQYCEHGIGTKKNLEYALHFYKKANDFGLERANILYKNLKRKKGLFSFLFKSDV